MFGGGQERTCGENQESHKAEINERKEMLKIGSIRLSAESAHIPGRDNSC
jgi:hypothetical protein